MRPNAVSYKAIGAALTVHRALGPGLLESAYETCLSHELARSGLHFEHQVRLPVVYEGIILPAAYRADFIVEKCVILEVKAVEILLPVHEAQLISYLKLAGYPLGLLINFNVRCLRDGIRRVINAPESKL